jgi:hypothetical protein
VIKKNKVLKRRRERAVDENRKHNFKASNTNNLK